MATPRASIAMCALVFLAPEILLGLGADAPVDTARISTIIQAASSKDHQRIADLISYPMGRWYPVPSIRSSAECMKRFGEAFDDELLSDIAHSDPKRDWERVGSRGIMLGNGEVWLDEDYKIIAINHETDAGKALRARLIAEQKRRLPAGLRDFDDPVLEWITPHFLIRVDKKAGDFRLIVFSGHSYAKAIHVLSHGDQQFDGSGGAYNLEWQTDGRTYRVYVDPYYGEYCSYEEYDGPVGPPGLENRPPALKEHGRERVK